MTRSLLGWVVGTIMLTLSGSLSATELRVPSGVGAPISVSAAASALPMLTTPNCVRPTASVSTRVNYDTTEPHYYFGQMRHYPQYYIDGLATHGTC